MIDLRKQDTPAYYEIAPLDDKVGLRISVHPDANIELQEIFSQSQIPLIASYRQAFGLKNLFLIIKQGGESEG